MRRGLIRGLLVAIIATIAGRPAVATPQPRLITDVSQSRIEIEYSFVGAELLIFGAVQYPGGRIPEATPGIAIVVRGAAEPIIVRRKERVLGIWMNTASARFETAPSFYAAVTSAPIRELMDERTAAIFEIGLDHLQLSPASGGAPADVQAFQQGLLGLRRREGLYAEDEAGVEVIENVLYRARIALPVRVPVGNYAVEIYLIRDGEVVARSERQIVIDKSGFERAIYVAAQEHAFAYGLTAVAMALAAGWIASVVRR